MRRRPVIFALLTLIALSAVTASQAEVVQRGNLRVKFAADFTPHILPRTRPAPVRVEIAGTIATTDGSHPPSLRWLEVELNRSGRLTTAGLPVCSAPLLQSTSSDQARSRCGSAAVGGGDFEAAVSLGGDVQTNGQIIAFNSRLEGRSALLLHFFARVPVRFTLIVPLKIVRKRDGDFGTLLRTRVPRIAGGLGSITRLDLTIGRRYAAGGERRSYLAAACSAPTGVSIAPFDFARARFRFDDHAPIDSSLTSYCRVRS
jgi:hypothetical protein